MKAHRSSSSTRDFTIASFGLSLLCCFILLFFTSSTLVVCGRPAALLLLASAGHHGGDMMMISRDGSSLINMGGIHAQQLGNEQEGRRKGIRGRSHGRGLIAKVLGSRPPKCVSKCFKCTPCQAVRVPIQPRRTKVDLMEYYPEAWRCKCKNKLYMP